MRAVVTICSRAKSQAPGPLAACLRYTAPHIKQAQAIARAQQAPFFLLSGLYGLIHEHLSIPAYDYLLDDVNAGGLVGTVAGQLKDYGITGVCLCVEDKPSWEPYVRTLEQAAAQVGIPLDKLVLDSEHK